MALLVTKHVWEQLAAVLMQSSKITSIVIFTKHCMSLSIQLMELYSVRVEPRFFGSPEIFWAISPDFRGTRIAVSG